MLKIPHLSILIFSIYSTQKKVLNDNKSSSNSSDHIMRYNRHFSNIHQTLPNNITLHNKNIDEVGKIFIEKQVNVQKSAYCDNKNYEVHSVCFNQYECHLEAVLQMRVSRQ